MNIKQLMKQAQQMQEQMQRQMSNIRVEGTAGGGMVKAEMSGNKEDFPNVVLRTDAISFR